MFSFSLFPRKRAFFDMFHEAAQNMVVGGRLLKEMMEGYQDIEQKAREIKRVESAGDAITHTIFRNLNQTFITPIDREDIYALASCIDDVLDMIEATADRLVVFKIEKPTQEAIKLADIIYRSAEELGRGIAQLGKVTDLNATFVTVNSLENEADRITRDAIARLFESERDAIVVIKWKEIYESLEQTTDRCEDVANVLEQILLKHA
jgi:predicted phosphate transport protein (TIGR00153 family)